MKCPKCGRKLNTITSNTYVCPFCGDNFDANGNKKDNINQIMKSMTNKYGIELLNNADRVNALLMDLAPHAEKERKLLVAVMREGIITQLSRYVNENEKNQISGINKCVKQLVADIWITETAAKYAVKILATSMGIIYEYPSEIVMSVENSSATTNNQNISNILTKDMKLISEEAIKSALSKCVGIGYKALAVNSTIEEIELPPNIIHIYPKAFYNCINLKKIIISKNIKNIGNCAFEGCTNLKEILISDNSKFKVINGILIDKENKKTIRAINNKSFEIAKIVNGVLTLSKKTFDESKIKKVFIPMSLNCIEEKAFYLSTELTTFEVDSKNKNFRTIDGVLHNKRGTILLQYPQNKPGVNYYLEDFVEKIGVQAFSCAKNLETITLANSLKYIDDKAFEYCTKITNLILPSSVEKIGDRAFQYCIKMKSIMLSRNILEIGDCTFYRCESLETISVPKNIQKIGNLAFAYCLNLKSVMVQENLKFVGDGAFIGSEKLEILVRNNPYIEAYCHSHNIKYKKI